MTMTSVLRRQMNEKRSLLLFMLALRSRLFQSLDLLDFASSFPLHSAVQQ
jgi:hypothetical protein